MTDLIARLSAATEPSRRLDAEIARTEGWTGFSDYWLSPSGQQRQFHPPAYTSSIDAALTLVPEGYLWQLKRGFEATATVWSVMIDYDDQHPVPFGASMRPAIALCIAALRARGVG